MPNCRSFLSEINLCMALIAFIVVLNHGFSTSHRNFSVPKVTASYALAVTALNLYRLNGALFR